MTHDGSGGNESIDGHPVVFDDQWLAARSAFLADEKEFTRRRDELSRRRRALPWERSRNRMSSRTLAA